MQRDYLKFNISWQQSIKRLPIEKQGIMYNFVIDYAVLGIEPDDNTDESLRFMFYPIKEEIDKYNKRYMGHGGGAPKGNQNAKKQPKTTQSNPNQPKTIQTTEKDKTETEKERKSDIKRNTKEKEKTEKDFLTGGKSTRFAPPKKEEVLRYCQEINKVMNVDEFIDYYEMVGWTVGKSGKKMKDWKAAVRRWQEKPLNSNGNPKEELIHFGGDINDDDVESTKALFGIN